MIKKFFRKYGAAYAFLLPWILGMLLFTLVPMIISLYFSLTNFDLFGMPKFIGLDNYKTLFTNDIRYIQSLKVTSIYVFVGVPLKLLFSLLLALILEKGMRGIAFYRAIYYIPSLLGGSVAIAVLWRQVFGRAGIINGFLGLIGIESTTSWIAHPNYSLGTIIILMVWQFGSSMVIFLAGLKQIPKSLYESAEIDGAGWLAKFKKITLPMLSPVILFNLIMQFISAFQAFTPAYIIGGPEGKPLDSLLFYTLYLYTKGFTHLQMGYASAMAWMLVIIIGIFAGFIFYTSGKWVFYDE